MKGSRLEAGVDLAAYAGAAANGAVRVDAKLVLSSLVTAAGLIECDAVAERRGELLIDVPSSPARLARQLAQCVAV